MQIGWGIFCGDWRFYVLKARYGVTVKGWGAKPRYVLEQMRQVGPRSGGVGGLASWRVGKLAGWLMI